MPVTIRNKRKRKSSGATKASVERATQVELQRLGKELVKWLNARSPVRTGLFKSSIQPIGLNGNTSATQLGISSAVRYASFVRQRGTKTKLFKRVIPENQAIIAEAIERIKKKIAVDYTR